MKAVVLGSGMMGRAIAFDLSRFSQFEDILLVDNDKHVLTSARTFLKETTVETEQIDAENLNAVKILFRDVDVAISALPYRFNFSLAKIAVRTTTHFVDLGGNNSIVAAERRLSPQAKQKGVTIIPDSGLAPGLVSIITKDIVDTLDTVDTINLRVGGLPVHPQGPLNYQIVFSPYGLINEYVEDALVLDHGKILKKKSMTELETLRFPQPFGTMEAFLTSGGVSTLPTTYKKKIGYLDYKTIRYPGHCEKINTLLALGLGSETRIEMKGYQVSPRDVLVSLLQKHVPTAGEDVILLKVLSQGTKNGKHVSREYLIIDYYDSAQQMTAMMRTTGFPVSITAQMIENGIIKDRGVFCPEEIIPPRVFFQELKKRNIPLIVRTRSV
jgi:lysine 6-dehydrogenase